MTQNDEYYNKTNLPPKNLATIKDDDNEDGGRDDTGGQSGQIEFHDFLTPRDDLSFDEKKHLLLIHKDGNEVRVKKAKDLREIRIEAKEKIGNFLQAVYRFGGMGGGGGAENPYKPNPELINKAQFSGVDPPVNPVATQNNGKANEADRAAPENEYQKRYTPEVAPKFHPTPQQSTKLTRS